MRRPPPSEACTRKKTLRGPGPTPLQANPKRYQSGIPHPERSLRPRTEGSRRYPPPRRRRRPTNRTESPRRPWDLRPRGLVEGGRAPGTRGRGGCGTGLGILVLGDAVLPWERAVRWLGVRRRRLLVSGIFVLAVGEASGQGCAEGRLGCGFLVCGTIT